MFKNILLFILVVGWLVYSAIYWTTHTLKKTHAEDLEKSRLENERMQAWLLDFVSKQQLLASSVKNSTDLEEMKRLQKSMQGTLNTLSNLLSRDDVFDLLKKGAIKPIEGFVVQNNNDNEEDEFIDWEEASDFIQAKKLGIIEEEIRAEFANGRIAFKAFLKALKNNGARFHGNNKNEINNEKISIII